MDLMMSHAKAKAIVDSKGFEGFLKVINGYFPRYDLYGCGKDWYHNSKYICKLRGEHGDIIIGWHGVHDLQKSV